MSLSQVNEYLDSDFQTGMRWGLLWSPGQSRKNFRTAFSSIDTRVDAVARESLFGRVSQGCQTFTFRAKHLAASILLAIPFVCMITILALRRFGNIPNIKIEAPQINKAEPIVEPSVINKAESIESPQTLAKDERPAENLISPKRFDLMAKILYAEMRKKGILSQWGEEIYAAHIQAWSGFNERPDPNSSEPHKPKIGKKAYIDTFNEVLDSIKTDGYDKNRRGVPVGSKDGIAVNGAHRLAACYTYGKPVKVFESPLHEQCWNWDYKYWSQRCFLEEKYLDAMALKYCEVKKNVYALALFPCAREKNLDDKVMELIHEYGASIVYDKDIPLNLTGGKNFVVTSYYKDANASWLGTPENNYRGVDNNVKNKFLEHEGRPPMKMIFFESDVGLDKIKELKMKIRNLFNMGNPSVHITDDQEQTLDLARSTLNPNSIHHMNNRKNDRMERFEGYFKQLKQEIADKGIDPNDICVDGSAVLAAYGLRDCKDLDFLYHGAAIPNFGQQFECHNNHVREYGLNPDDIIYDPKNHFWHQGIKFASLGCLRALKQERFNRNADPKDAQDLALMLPLIPA